MHRHHLRAGGGLPGLRFLLPLLLVAWLAPAGAVDPNRPGWTAESTYDLRLHGGSRLAELIEERSGLGPPERAAVGRDRARQRALALGRLREERPGVEIRVSTLTGSTEMVRSPRGALTAKAPGRSPRQVARDFLRGRAALYGLTPDQAERLEVLGESRGRRGGLRLVRLRQSLHGLPVFQSETRAVVDGEGRLVATVGRLVPGVERTGKPVIPDLLTAEEALRSALRSLRLGIESSAIRPAEAASPGWSSSLAVDHPRVSRTVPGRLVWFPLAAGVLTPAWAQVITYRGPGDWYTVVDARSGELLYRKNIERRASMEEARFSLYARTGGDPADSPAPASPNLAVVGAGQQYAEISRSILAMSALQDATASPEGWIPDGGDTTTGNNADVYLDWDLDDLPDLGTLDRDGRPVGNPDGSGNDRDFLGTSPRDYAFTPPPVGGDPDLGDDPTSPAYQRGALAQLFATINWFHDRLYGLGFDEGAGNFQTDNFGRGGLGGDPVLAGAQYGAALLLSDSANVSPTPDGLPLIARFSLFQGPFPARDSALDAEIVLHELAHGLTNRIIGDGAGLNWTPGLGLGEGWSDYYALSLLNDEPADDPDGQYALGAYASYLIAYLLEDNYVYGLRRFPYSTDNAVNPLTWADADDISDDMSGGLPTSLLGFEFAGAWETHNLGEIWGLTLWEARSRVIAQHGGDVAAGNEAMLGIVTDALFLTPTDPSFTEARDALLDADCAASACAHEQALWEGFADRGLGYGAEASLGIATHVGVRESFALPHLEVAGVNVDDSAGNGNGSIDPGEEISIVVELANPWRASSKGASAVAATLSSTTPGLTILDGSSSYGSLPAQGTAAGDPFRFSLELAPGCGLSLDFELETTSELGTTTASFTLRTGEAQGPGAPVTLSRTVPGGLPIPEADARGVHDTLPVSEDLEIHDLDLLIDELRHTGIGDLSVELKGPSGLGMDLVFRPADCVELLGCALGLNAGVDLIGTRIDDDSPNDLLIAGAEAAPFTGHWFPVHNSPEWDFHDPVGQLSHFGGLGTKGDWQLFVADHEIFDEGSLEAWSLVVTPVEYACCTPLEDLDGDGTGDFCDNCPATPNPGQEDGDGDGAGNVCDCAPGDPGVFAVPGEIGGLVFQADEVTLSWDSAASSAGPDTRYDLLRGGLEELPPGSGGGETCLTQSVPGTSAQDTATPAAGAGFYYLVRGTNGCGDGGWGADSESSERSSGACP
jgi:subtilisin-like proprotein convertase family protein